MSQIDFYILQGQQPKERLACQLAEKAWEQGYRVYIQTTSIAAAKILDDMLWTYKQDSFVPHDLYPDVAQSAAEVRIGYTDEVCANMDVLINLTETVPTFYTQFRRIVELVDNNESAREIGRQRYRFYREQGNELKSHEINK